MTDYLLSVQYDRLPVQCTVGQTTCTVYCITDYLYSVLYDTTTTVYCITDYLYSELYDRLPVQCTV